MAISTPQNVIRERQRNVAGGFAGLDADGRILAPLKMGTIAQLGVLPIGVLAVETTGGALGTGTAVSLRVGDGTTAGGVELANLRPKLLLES